MYSDFGINFFEMPSGGGPVSPENILAALLTVDGPGSGLDADLFDGLDSDAFFQVADATPIGDMTDTWNNGGTVFDAIKMNVTNTASSAFSSLLNLQVDDEPLLRLLATNKLEFYRTYTDETNYERAQFSWDANNFILEMQDDGTGSAKGFQIKHNAGNIMTLNSGGMAYSSAAHFGYHLYLDTVGTIIDFYSRLYLDAPAASMFRLRATDGTGALMQLGEMTAPANAPADSAYLYCDVSGGKTRLMVIFQSGTAFELAAEA
jgi:hypothetical protein